MKWFQRFFSKLASGGLSPSPAVESARQPTFVTITEFATVPKRVVVGGPYHSREFAETAAAVARAQLGSFAVPYSVRVEPSPMSSSSTPDTAPDSGEAKTCVHFNLQGGDQCPNCLKIIVRDKNGREIQ